MNSLAAHEGLLSEVYLSLLHHSATIQRPMWLVAQDAERSRPSRPYAYIDGTFDNCRVCRLLLPRPARARRISSSQTASFNLRNALSELDLVRFPVLAFLGSLAYWVTLAASSQSHYKNYEVL